MEWGALGARGNLEMENKAKGCEEAVEKSVKSKEKIGQFWNFVMTM